MKALKGSLRILSRNKELAFLGLAAKAGRIVSGEFATEKGVKSGQVF